MLHVAWLHYKGIYMYVYSFWIDTKLYHMCVYIACIYIYGYWALYQRAYTLVNKNHLAT